jgi:hypothetical protein
LCVGAPERSHAEPDVQVISSSPVVSKATDWSKHRGANVHEEERHSQLSTGECSILLDLRG